MAVRAWAAVALLGGLAACSLMSTMRIHIQQDPSVDLAPYATYGWASPPRSEPDSLDWRLRAAVDEQLTQRGYTPVDGHPDLLVGYHLRTREREMGDSLVDYYRYRQEGGREDYGSAWVSGYQEGSLVVEVVDPLGQRILWRGSATAVVNPDLREQRLTEAVRRMFAQFPEHVAAAPGDPPRPAAR
jgi:hypothetical protein